MPSGQEADEGYSDQGGHFRVHIKIPRLLRLLQVASVWPKSVCNVLVTNGETQKF